MLGKSSTICTEPAPVHDGLVKKIVKIRRLPCFRIFDYSSQLQM